MFGKQNERGEGQMAEQLQLRLEWQRNPVADEVSALTAVVRPILQGVLFALKQDVVAEVLALQSS